MSQDMRARYMNERVMTATPGQRIVMLYDRLALDLARANSAATGQPLTPGAVPKQQAPPEPAQAQAQAQQTQAQAQPTQQEAQLAAAPHIDHAMQIIGALAGSLEATDETSDVADNLASLYGYLLRELSAARGGELAKLTNAGTIITDLRETWRQAVAQTASEKAAPGVRVG